MGVGGSWERSVGPGAKQARGKGGHAGKPRAGGKAGRQAGSLGGRQAWWWALKQLRALLLLPPTATHPPLPALPLDITHSPMLKMLLSRVPLISMAVSSSTSRAAAGSSSSGPAARRRLEGCRVKPNRWSKGAAGSGMSGVGREWPEMLGKGRETFSCKAWLAPSATTLGHPACNPCHRALPPLTCMPSKVAR